MLKYVLLYQVCCFGSVTLILWKMEDKFSDAHLSSKSAAPSQRNSGGAGGIMHRECVERVLNYQSSTMYVCKSECMVSENVCCYKNFTT